MGGGNTAKVKLETFREGVVMAPIIGDDEMQEFFLNWKVPFNRRRILVGK